MGRSMSAASVSNIDVTIDCPCGETYVLSEIEPGLNIEDSCEDCGQNIEFSIAVWIEGVAQ
jgi:hypothetical protein